MTVVNVQKDPAALTMTVVTEFDASTERVWRVWEDPRQLERWWGPPTWPATFERHDFKVGGECRYYMTGPQGEKAHGWWRITTIEEPHRLEVDDGFADDNGEPLDPSDATHMVVTIENTGAGTTMTVLTRFNSLAQMEKHLEMGMEEGIRLAIGQVDDVLAGASA